MLFFIVVIFMGSFYLVNLILARSTWSTSSWLVLPGQPRSTWWYSWARSTWSTTFYLVNLILSHSTYSTTFYLVNHVLPGQPHPGDRRHVVWRLPEERSGGSRRGGGRRRRRRGMLARAYVRRTVCVYLISSSSSSSSWNHRRTLSVKSVATTDLYYIF